MKANQPKVSEQNFDTPLCRKGGNCRECGKPIEDYRGIHIGAFVYCDHACFACFAFPLGGDP